MKTKHLFIIQDKKGGPITIHWSITKTYGGNQNVFEVYPIPEAIHRNDITNAINRYIIKPLNK